MANATSTIDSLKQELALQNRALSASSCGITIADARQKDMPLVYVNAAFENICGYSAEEVMGKNCRFLQGRVRDEAARAQIRHAIEHREHLRIVLKNYRKDGTLFWNEMNLSPVLDMEGGLTHFIGIQTDVTEREEVKAKLLTRTQELEAACLELKGLSADKDRLLGIVAHDLRGPLGSLTQLLDFVTETEDKNDRDELIRMSSEVAGNTLTLVNDLLDVSAIKTGRLEITKRPTDLHAYFAGLAKASARNAARKAITLELQLHLEAPEFSIDPNRVDQIVNNLIGNAIKFSNRGTKIILVVQSTKQGIRIEVTDEGQGIQESELHKLFGEFSKTSTLPTENESSSGLGLSICKRITELHGGRIAATSELGRGSTFTVSLDR